MATLKLKPEDIGKIQQAQRQFHDLFEDMDKLENCGVDCQEIRSIAQQYIELGNRLMQNFGTMPQL